MRDATLILLFLSCLFISCNNCSSKFIYDQPENINDGLRVGTLESVNMDTAIIAKAVNKLHCGKFGEVHSMLIYKDNLLVLEEYFQGHSFKWDAPCLSWRIGGLESKHGSFNDVVYQKFYVSLYWNCN